MGIDNQALSFAARVLPEPGVGKNAGLVEELAAGFVFGEVALHRPSLPSTTLWR